MRDFSQLEKKLKIKFKKIDFLKQAFTHRSYLNEHPRWSYGHNERLEFLGDAVLELVVSEYLFENFPNESEGFLTNLRASLVNAQTLSRLAEQLEFNQFMLLSRGEAKDTGRGRRYILANTFEALVGAIYLDQGYSRARRFIVAQLIKKFLPEILKTGRLKDPKSYFQEKAQGELGITPFYKLLEEWGPDHAKHFRVGVYLGEELIAEGEGNSKQEAEMEAAQKALEIKGW